MGDGIGSPWFQWRYLIVIAAIVAFSGMPAVAETIEIVTEDLPPFQVVENGIIGGVTTEIVTTAAQRAGLEYTIAAYPWARTYRMARHKQNVCIYSLFRSKEREKHFRWAGKLVRFRNHYYKLADRVDVQVNSLEDARRYNTVVVRDDGTHHFLRAHGFTDHKNIYITNDYPSAFRLLFAAAGVSLIVNDDVTLLYRTKQAHVDPARLEQLFEIREMHGDLEVAFSLLTPIHTVNRFSTALKEMKADGTFDRIWRKYQVGPKQ
jgi:polar amino acid transport system substrate-binding protein